MSFSYPLALDLVDKACLVVGGGVVASRKIEALLSCGALVTVITPSVTQEIQKLADEGRISLEKREYRAGDVTGFRLVVAATNDNQVNIMVSSDARRFNVLVNVVDKPDQSDFIVPAVVRRGDLLIAIFTDGKSPALAKKLRIQLQEQFGPEYETFVDILGKMREKVKARYPNQKDREVIFNRLLEIDILEEIRTGNLEEAWRKALECI